MIPAGNQEKKWEDFYRKPVSLPDFIRLIDSHKTYLSVLLKFLEPGDKVLEVGCGTAVNSIYLSHLGYKVASIDSNDKVLELSKRNNENFHGAIDFSLQDMFKLSFNDNDFKLSFSAAVISCYSVPEVRKAIAEQLRVAKYVMFCEPTTYFVGHQSFESSNLWSFKEWLEIIKDFKLMDYGGYGYGRWGRIFSKLDNAIFKNRFKRLIVQRFAPQVYFIVSR